MNKGTIICGNLTAFLALFFCAEGLSQAQDYQRYAPKPPPSASVPAQLPATFSPVTGSDEELVVNLKGVVFVSDPKQISPGVITAAGIITNGIPLLQFSDFDAVVAPYLGKPISLKSMNRLIQAVIIYCRDHDRPVVDVSLPEQDLTGGAVQLLFIEGKVSKIEARDNRWFSDQLIEDGVQLKRNGPISSARLLDDLDTLNKNPFRNSNVLLTPGSTPGSTDIVVQTQDRFPLRVYTGYDDTGNSLTGYDRWDAGFNWGNVFGVGHLLNYQFTTSSNFDSLVAHAASYVIPLPWRHTLTLYGAISTSNVIESGFDFRGGGTQAGLRYEIPFATFRGANAKTPFSYAESIYAGYDWKQSDNFIEFGVIPVNNAVTDIGEWVLGYKGTETDPWGTLTINPELDFNRAGTWDFDNNTSYALARTGADSNFAYFKGDLSRTTRLPWNFSLLNDLRGQISTTNLLPSEQMVFGGEDSISGYDEEDINGTDNGWLIRNELETPAISLSQLFSPKFGHILNDQLQFLAFFDYGQTWSHQGMLTLNNGRSVSEAEFVGVGPGLRYTIGNYLSVRADYGFQLHDVGDSGASRWHLAFTLSY